jgi:2,4-dienoyl-CoA reductase-like NADH-dependent reductase (Old Yellow Enzyme family)
VSRLFEPFALGPVKLRNRLVKAAAFEGMCPEGRPSDALVAHHRAVAAGGAALCTVAYAAVSRGGRSFRHQMWMHDGMRSELQRVSDAIHAEGAAASIQLGHGGCMADAAVTGEAVLAPSRVANLYGLVLPRAMSEHDITTVVRDFEHATELAREAGFDAVEIQAGHGYLLSQFLSPFSNRRRDRWGGSLENRARMLVEVLRRVRTQAGARMAVTVKLNLRDGFAGGLELEEAIAVARIAAGEGADALQLSGGFTSKTPWYILRGDVPYEEIRQGEPRALRKLGIALFGKLMVEPLSFEEAYFFEMAREVRAAVSVPLMLVGGLRRRATMERVLDAGIELLAMARPFIRDPAFATTLRQMDAESSCVPCNRCVAAMYHAEQRCPFADPPTEAATRV